MKTFFMIRLDLTLISIFMLLQKNGIKYKKKIGQKKCIWIKTKSSILKINPSVLILFLKLIMYPSNN